MVPKKISLDQIDLSSRALAEIFRCSYDKSHLVEDPFVCQKAFCQKIVCKSCYFLINCCPSCGVSINSFSNSLLPYQKNMLNQINLSCENKARGCLVEIDYESYRSHTKNCKYRENFVPVSFITENKTSNLIDAEKAFLLEQMSKTKIQFQENNLSSINSISNSSQPIKPSANQEKEGNNLEKYTSSFVLDFGKKVLSSFASNLENKIIASLAPNEKKKDEPEKKSIPPCVPIKSECLEKSEGPSKLISLSHQNSKNSTNPLLSKNPKPKKKIVKNEELLKFKLEDYEALTIPELKKILSRRNIPKSGNKSDLINKLLMYVDYLKSKGKVAVGEQFSESNDSEEDEDSESDSDDDDDDDSIEGPCNNQNNLFYHMQGCTISDSKLRKLNKKDYENLTVEDLKDLLEQRSIPKTGNKQDLIIKLQQYLLQSEQKKPTKKISKDPNSKKMKKEKLMMSLLEKTNDELKDILYRLGKPVSGNKSELISRILNR